MNLRLPSAIAQWSIQRQRGHPAIIHELGARRFSLRAIGRKLAAEGILRRGHAWHHSLIKSILEREEPSAGQATECEGPLIRCG